MFSNLNIDRGVIKIIIFCFIIGLLFSFVKTGVTATTGVGEQLLQTEVNYPRIPGTTPPQEIPKDSTDEQAFPLFMGYMFRIILIGSIIVAVTVIFYGGVLYILSQNNPEKRNQAIGWIRGAIQGALIMLFSHFILASIDSRFLIFKTSDLQEVESPEGITIDDEIKDTYFQIPLGLLIEDLATNEVARDRMYDVLDANYDAEDSARGIMMGITNMTDIINYCKVGSSCSGNRALNTGGWPSITFNSIANLKVFRHPMGCWWEENATRSDKSSEIKKPEMERLGKTIFDHGLINLEEQKSLLNLKRIELEEINKNRLPGVSEEIKRKVSEITERMRNIINHQERKDNFIAEAREITKIIYEIQEKYPEINNTPLHKEFERITNFSNERNGLPKWDKGYNDVPYVEQSDIRWRHFRYGWSTLEKQGSLLASATMALQAFGVEMTIFDALSFSEQNNYQTSPLSGTMFDFLEHIVRDYGFNYDKATSPNINDINKIIDWLASQKGTVVIEGTNLPWSTEEDIKHSIVLTGVNRQGRLFYINDPRNPFRNVIKIDDVMTNLPSNIGYVYNGEAYKCGSPITHGDKSYKTVKIGSQCWVAENMDYDNGCYRKQLTPSRRDGCGYYINESGREVKDYGLLYQWDAASEACPDGWRLATDNDWRILEREIGMEDSTTSLVWRGIWRSNGDVGRKLKSTSDWILSGGGSDDYEFNALPGGFWRPRALPEPDELGNPFSFGFSGIREEGSWWASSLIKGGSHANMRGMHSSQAGIKRSADSKDYAFSVRCTMDIPTGRTHIDPADFFDSDNLNLEDEETCLQITPALNERTSTMERYNEKFYNDLIVLYQSKRIIEENMYQLHRALALKSLGVNHIIDYSQLLSQKLEYKISSKINTKSDIDFAVLHRFNKNPSNPHSWNWQKWEDNTLYWTDEVVGEGDEKACVIATIENDPLNFYLKTPETSDIIFDALIELTHQEKQKGLQYAVARNITSNNNQKDNYAKNTFTELTINFIKNLVLTITDNLVYASNRPTTIEECIHKLGIDIENITQKDVDRIYNECDPSLTRMPGENPEDYLTCGMEIPVGEIMDILWNNYNEILFAIDGYIAEGLKLLEMQKDFVDIASRCSCVCVAGECAVNCDADRINNVYYIEVAEHRGKMRAITRYIHHLTNGFFWAPTVNICSRSNIDIISNEEKDICKDIDYFITKHELVARKLNYSRSKFNQCLVRPEETEEVLTWGKIGTRTYFGPIVEMHDVPRNTKTIIGNIVQNTHEFNWFCCTDYEDY